MWVGNVYLPPVQSLQKRKINEEVACSMIDDVIECFQNKITTVMCGDWNTRIGNVSPEIEEMSIPRLSED